MHTVHLEQLKWADVEAYLGTKDTILLPIGSTEQHGHHLPLGTDTLVAARLAAEAGKAAGVLVAPPMWFGWCPHHLAFPGTANMQPDTIVAMVTDFCLSMVRHGFNKVVVVNGHRDANLPPLKIAASKVRHSTGMAVYLFDPFFSGELAGRAVRTSEPGGVGHAAELETSHMLHIHPELCDMSRAVRNLPAVRKFHCVDPYVEIDRVFVASSLTGFRERSNGVGVIGDPTVATAEKGAEYHRQVTANLVELLAEVLHAPGEVFNRTPVMY